MFLGGLGSFGGVEMNVGWVFALTPTLSPMRGGMLNGGWVFAPGSSPGQALTPTGLRQAQGERVLDLPVGRMRLPCTCIVDGMAVG